MPEPVNASQRCICEICTCGRHRCPHNPGPPLQFGDDTGQHSTEYYEMFKKNGALPREAAHKVVPREQIQRAEGVMDNASTSKTDYVAHEVSKPTRVKRNAEGLNVEGDMDFTTNYNTQFDRTNGAERARAIHHDSQLTLNGGTFEASPSYADDFKTWSIEKPERVRRPTDYHPPDAPFEGQTTSKQDFQDLKAEGVVRGKRPKTALKVGDGGFTQTTSQMVDFAEPALSPRGSRRPIESYKSPTEPFIADTTANAHYKPWEVQVPQKRRAEAYVKPEGDFQGMTTNKAEFTGNAAGERAQLIKPQTETKMFGGDFDSRTTSKKDYPEWEVQPHQRRQQQEYVKPEGEFHGVTTNKAEFTGNDQVARTQAIRPKDGEKLLDGEFDSHTTVKQDYPAWDVQPINRRQQQEYVKPDGEFHGVTTNKAEYTGLDAGGKVEAIRPKENENLLDGEFDSKTTSKQDYPAWDVQPMQRRQAEQYVKPEGTFEGVTTNKAEYTGNDQVGRVQLIRPKTSNKLLDGDFDSKTTVKQDYPGWDVQPRQKRQKQEYVKPEGEFHGVTTNKAEYNDKQQGEKAQLIRPRSSNKLLDGDFESNTTNKQDYPAHSVERTLTMKPMQTAAMSSDPFDGVTTLQQDYKPWDVQPKQRRQLEEYVKPEKEFHGVTTNKEAYVGREQGERTLAIRPKTSNKLLDGEFDSHTTVKQDYPAWDVQRVQRRQQQEYVKPEGEFHGVTTNKAEFTGNDQVARTQAIRPRDGEKLLDGEFDSKTTVKQDYPAWDVQPPTKRRQQEYVKPEGSFEGVTTNKAEYVARGQEERTKSIRPKTSEKLLDGDFDSKTTSKQDYPPWEVQPFQRRQQEQYVKPEGEFQGVTSNKAEYTGKDQGERTQPIRPRTSEKLLDGDFDSKTTAKQDYPAWDVQPVQRRRAEQYVKPEGEFEGVTTNKAEFDGKQQGERTQLIRPRTSEKLLDGEFSNNTTVKQDYPAWDVQAPQKRQQQEYVKPEGKFEGVTTNNAEYVNREQGERTKAIRPKTSEKLLDGDFDSKTTANQDYPAWDVQPIQRRQHEAYVKPEGEFEGMTTNKAEYDGKEQGERTQLIRPKTSNKLLDGEFDSKTTANQDYPPWEVQPFRKRLQEQYVKPEGEFQGVTTNKAEFIGNDQMERTKPIRPRTSEKLLDGDFDSKTTAKQDYPAWEVQPVQRRHAEQYVKPEGEFEGVTTNKAEYTGNGQIERTHPIRPRTSEKLLGDFDSKTTAKQDYPAWDVQPVQRRHAEQYVKPEGEFQGVTTNKAEFLAQDAGERTRAIRPRTSEKLLDGDFDNKTTSKQDYPPWEVQPFRKRQQEQYVKPEGEFQGVTTNKAEFTGKDQIERTQPIRPPTSEKLLDGDFDSKTTANQDYPAWDVQPVQKRHAEQYVKPEGEFEGVTTNKAEFMGTNQIERTKPIRPRTAEKLLDGDFDSKTTANQDYPAWDVQPVQRRQAEQYVKPEGEFQGVTTNKAEYLAQDAGERTRAIRPREADKLFDGGFDSQTTIKQDYPEWEVQPVHRRHAEQYVKPEGEFQGLTTNKAEFTGKDQAERTQLIRPKENEKLLDGDFDNKTTVKQDYPAWDVQPVQRRQAEQYVKPEGEFEGTTTNQAAFMAQDAGERTRAIRPRENDKLFDGGFDSNTTVKKDYPEWEVQPVQKRQAEQYVKPEGEFQGLTTNKAEFTGQDQAQRTQLIRPKENEKLLDGDFDNKTTVKQDYPAWDVQPVQRRQAEQYVKPEGEFEGTTTNQAAFMAQDAGEKTRAIRPRTSEKLLQGDFNAKSTAKEDYLAWEVQPVQRRQQEKYVKPEGEFQGITTNQAEYVGNDRGERTKAIRPKTSNKLLDGEFDSNTTVKKDYPAWDVQPVQRRQAEEYVKPDGEFQGTTTNKAEFTGKDQAERTKLIRPRENEKLLDGDFDSKTTAQEDYPAWDVQPVHKRLAEQYVKPDGEFEGTTTNKVAFMAQDAGERTRAIRPRENDKLFDGGFDSNTTVKKDYPEWEVQPVQKRQAEQYVKPEGEFQGLTTNKAEFTGKDQAERTQLIRPKENEKLLDGDFDNKTTVKQDYPAWDVQPVQRHQAEQYVKPEGEFDGTTTNKAAFMAQDAGERTRAIRPREADKLFDGGFDSKTTIKQDYPEWEVQPVQRKQAEQYVKPEGEFQGLTTNKAEYTGKDQAERTQLIRPRESEKLLNGDFDNKTTAKQDYPAWDVQPVQRRQAEQYVKPEGEFQGLTTNKAEYTGIDQAERARLIRPKENEKFLDGGFDNKTTVKQDYPAWDVQPMQRRQAEQYVKPEGEFEGTTTNKAAFMAQDAGERTRAIRPRTDNKLLDGEFQGTTTHQSAFTNVPTERTRPIRPPAGHNILGEGAFQGETTNKSEFTGKDQMQRTRPIRPETVTISGGEFQGTTTHQAAFTNVPTERTKPIRPHLTSHVGIGQFDGTTTQKSDFLTHKTERTQPVRPITNKTFPGGGNFEGETTAMRDFKPQEAQTRVTRRKEDYVKPEGTVDHRTTQKSHFGETSAVYERTKPIRPSTSTKIGGGGAFENGTTNKDSFRLWDAPQPAQRVTVVQEYKPPTDKFAATTTTRSAFPQYAVEPARAKAIHNVGSSLTFGNNNSSPFEGGTSYRSQYQSKAVDPHVCPVVLIGTDKSDYLYRGDRGGHKYYRPSAHH